MTVSAPASAALNSTNQHADFFSGTNSYSAIVNTVDPSTLNKDKTPEKWYKFGHATWNPVNGNKNRSIPIVGCTAKGGLPVSLNLVHNSLSTKNDVLGNKWTHSYDVTGSTDGSGNVSIHFGDDSTFTWALSGGVYIPPLGHYDNLVKNMDNTYTLTWKNQTKWNFTTALRLSAIVDENGNTITLGYDGSNRVHTITDPTSRVITINYTGSTISSITDPLSRTWSLTYSSGDLTNIALPVVGGVTNHIVMAYTSHNITTYTTPRGFNYTASFNLDNSLNWEKDPYLNQTSYTYTPISGGVYTRTITDPNSKVTTLSLDAYNRLTKVTDPLTYHEDYLYDGSNNRTQVTDKRGKVWKSTYDVNANQLTAKDPLLNVTTLTYNAHNYLLTSKQPIGEETDYTYDGSDNLTAITYKDKFGTSQASVSYTVNGSGQRTDYYDANAHHYTYAYDTNGNLNSVTTPNGHSTTGVFDAIGFCTSRTDALSHTTTYTPDNWERLATITYPDTSTKTYTNDADNNLTRGRIGERQKPCLDYCSLSSRHRFKWKTRWLWWWFVS